MLAQQNAEARDLVWHYITKSSDDLNATYGSCVFLLARLYKGVMECFNKTEGVLSEFVETIEGDKLISARQAIKQGFETVEQHQKIYQQNVDVFKTWLN